jgi:hypothetical protein
MSFPLFDLYKDLAVAQASSGPPNDPTKSDEVEARLFRRRIAGLLWIPGLAGVVFLAGWADSVAVAVIGSALLLAGLWLFAERGDQIAARLRRPRPS